MAGVPAAVAAARRGLGTLLVERSAFPGGAGVVAGHREICGLYAQAEEPLLLQRGGLVEEICSALAEGPLERASRRKGRVHVLPYSPDRLQSVYGGLIAAADRLESRFGCAVTGVEREGGTIRLVSCEEAGETRTIEPRVVIDGSGGGVVLKMAGAGYCEEPPEERQLAGYHFRLEGVDGGDEMLPYSVPFCLNRLVREEGLPAYLRFTTYGAGASGQDGLCRLNVPPFPSDGRRRRAEEDARLVHRILSREIPSLKGSRIAFGGACVCDRDAG